MKRHTLTRAASLGLSAALAFGVAACEADVDDDPDTTVVEDDTAEDGGDTLIEEGDDTDVTVEDDATMEEDASMDESTEETTDEG